MVLVRLNDLDNIENNECGWTWWIVEYKRDCHSFLPDLTLLINGLTLVVDKLKKNDLYWYWKLYK
ncbi:hypothetical protein HYD72_02825 [Mycoplasmopsis bovis]|nr:hypothetical protein [Mycoplasmopsis bovis]QQH49332.1 hypothetical protein HYD72_02825 [Mycoplasmopsis bovis]